MTDNADREWPVEFRMVRKYIPISDELSKAELRLQVRYRDDNTGVHFINKNDRYTAWQDVPIAEDQ